MTSTFSIEDIHKIRYDNYEKTKNFSHKELIEYTKNEAAEARELLSKLKRESLK